MKLRVLFYKAKWDGHLLDDLISSWTWLFNMGTGPYSHAEIWIPDENSYDDDGFYGMYEKSYYPESRTVMTWKNWKGTCYTSTMRKGVCLQCKGTRGYLFYNHILEEDEFLKCPKCKGKGEIKYSGVVARPAAEVLKHPGRWCYVEIEVTQDAYDNLIEGMDGSVKDNPGYDIWCILSFFWYKRLFAGKKFICSEFCQAALFIVGVFKELRCPSPRRLSRWLVDKGYKIHSLGE